MEWTEEHDILLMREMMVSDLFLQKKGSPSRGLIWESILENLNKSDSPVFELKDKRSVRDRWTLLKNKYKNKIRKEEAASGIDVEDLSEKEVLIEELAAKEDSFVDDSSARKQKEKDDAEDMRKKAMERMGDTKKRKSGEENKDLKAKKPRRGSGELVEYLREKTKEETCLRREEMELRKNEQEMQQYAASHAAIQQTEMMKLMQQQSQKMMESQTLLFQQQQQMALAFLAVIQKSNEK